jgi:predicted transcriptional regulator
VVVGLLGLLQNPEFAEILKRGLNHTAFARMAGVSAATLSHVVNGRPANPRTVVAIVHALVQLPVIAGVDDFLEEMPG